MPPTIRVEPGSHGRPVERAPQPDQLVLDESVHGVQDESADGWRMSFLADALLRERRRRWLPPMRAIRAALPCPRARLLEKATKQGQEHRFCLPRSRTRGKNDVSP